MGIALCGIQLKWNEKQSENESVDQARAVKIFGDESTTVNTTQLAQSILSSDNATALYIPTICRHLLDRHYC